MQRADESYHKGDCYEKALLPYFGIKGREEAYQFMMAHRHLLEADTVVHEDFCLPNIILDKGVFSCLIDVGLLGRNDRHVDLFWAIWSLSFNLGTDHYTDLFLEHYGRDLVDWERLQTVAAIETFSSST